MLRRSSNNDRPTIVEEISTGSATKTTKARAHSQPAFRSYSEPSTSEQQCDQREPSPSAPSVDDDRQQYLKKQMVRHPEPRLGLC